MAHCGRDMLGTMDSASQQPESARIQSIDIFRGLTMAVMIFVNDVASVKGLPWWTYHMPGGQNGMTYVDVVFPAFLFILGMAIPLAVARRERKSGAGLGLWTHIVMRSLSLVVLGVILANAWKADPKLTGFPDHTWPTFALVGAILFWLVYPRGSHQTCSRVLKYGGLAMLAVALILFRRTTQSGETAWLDFGYWEILGLIGRAYLATCILYVPLRKIAWAPAALLAVLTALNAASRMGMTPWRRIFPYALWPFDSGALPSIAMAGVVAYQIFFGGPAGRPFRRRAALGIAYAAVLFTAGWALTPLGISKNAATPSWCLFSSAISTLLFAGVYWLADVRGYSNWAAFARPAGANTLLTYLLPDLFYFTCGAAYASWTPGYGWPGVVRAILFTAAMLALSAVLTRKHVRMQL